MKRLFEIIREIESEIEQAESDKKLACCLQMAEHLDLVNANKQRFYLNQILESNNLEANNPLRIQAEILLAGAVINQMQTKEALDIAESALKKARLIQNKKLILEAKLSRAIILQYNGKAEEAVAEAEECIQEATSMNDAELIRAAYTYASLIYTDKDLAVSGNYAMKALEYALQIGKPWRVGFNYAMLGYWARENKAWEDAYNYFKEAAVLLEQEGADEYYGNVLTQLSTFEKDRENFDIALQYLEKAQLIFTRIDNPRLKVINAISMGRLYRIQKIFDKAEQHYKEAIEIATEHKIEYENAAANVFLAHMFRDMGQLEKAIEYFEKGIAVFGENIRPSAKADLAKHLHSIYYKVGNLDKAYNTLLDYAEIRFKLQDENRIKETAKLQEQYEAEKREAELKEARLQQTESELKALKAQMNPHFIFNALNSIQEIFFLGDKRLANKHLSRFSQLMRNILKASGKKTITLQEEIDMLQEYLSLEALRFGDTFSFDIIADEKLDPYIFDVPPMVVQPFVENAVKHGLLHIEGNQKIKIRFDFDEHDNTIKVEVNDNGIGRKASAEINKHRTNHESFSTSATEKRFDILNQTSDSKFSFEYFDLENHEGAALGTSVIINIPVTA